MTVEVAGAPKSTGVTAAHPHPRGPCRGSFQRMANREVVYVNSSHADSRYVREAQRSAYAFKQFIPDARFVLYTDSEEAALDPFDEIRRAEFRVPEALAGTIHKNGQMVAKLEALCGLSSEQVLYLGSDTYALKPQVATMFALLDRFDIVAAHAPSRINTSLGNSHIPTIPESFPEFNCDVVLFRNTEGVRQLLREWSDLYLSNAFGHPHDQGAFRYLVYTSDLRIATLPEEYNYRGEIWRPDTVLLQNRQLLPTYIRDVNQPMIGRLKTQYRRTRTKVVRRTRELWNPRN